MFFFTEMSEIKIEELEHICIIVMGEPTTIMGIIYRSKIIPFERMRKHQEKT